MKFSDTDEALRESAAAGLNREKPHYAVLSVLIPCSALFSVLPLLGRFLSALVMRVSGGEIAAAPPLPYGAWFTAGFLSGFAASFYGGMIKKFKNDHAAADVRGAILVMALAYVVSSLLSFGKPGMGSRFFPSAFNIPAALTALVMWFAVIRVKRVFARRELFESHTARYSGEKLRQLMLEDAVLMTEADKGIAAILRFYVIHFVIAVFLVLACTGLGAAVSLPFLVLLTALFIAGFCVMGFLGVLRREHAFAAEGIVPAPADRVLTLPAAGLIIIGAAFAGALLSADTSLLPPALIAAFFSWLGRLISSLFKPSENPPPPPRFGEMPAAPVMPALPRELTDMAEQSEPWPYWDYVKYCMIGLAAVLFIWFMIHPLLSRPRLALGGITPLEYVRRFLIRWFSTAGRGLKSFLASLRGGGGRLKTAKPQAAALNRLAGNLLAGYSAAKRKEMRRSVTLFARLILWGTEYCGVAWKPSHAPGEFCALLAAALPAAANAASGPALIRCGELFEKALYSALPLPDDEGKEFKRLVEDVTADRPA
jgi:hypothetical protein